MAKTIKFNLFIDDNPIRDIKGLQDHFCIDDIEELFQNGILQKWLTVRGFTTYLEKVNKIKNGESAITELIKIFEINRPDEKINEEIYSLKFRKERKNKLEEWEKKNNNVKKIIADYHNGYNALKNEILEKKTDMPFLKSAAKEINKNYKELFEINRVQFFHDYREKSPLIIFAILMDEKLREIFLLRPDIKKILEQSFTLTTLPQLNAFNSALFSADEKGEERKDENPILTFKGGTEGYWKDIVPSNQKVMVLSIPEGTYVRNSGKSGEDLSSYDVLGSFLILNGLDYKSNNGTRSLVYMEI